MTTPLSHYPHDADFSALWRDMKYTYVSWRARSLLHQIRYKLANHGVDGRMEIAEQILAKDTSSMFDHWRGIDCAGMLSAWCSEAAELSSRAKKVLRSSALSEALSRDLTSAVCELDSTTSAAKVTQQVLCAVLALRKSLL